MGSELVRKGLRALADDGVPMVFLEGYRRPSLRIPEAGFQVCLLPAHASWMTGKLVYRHEFWDHDLVGLRPADPRGQLLTDGT